MGWRLREEPVSGRLCSMTAPVKLIDDKGKILFLAGCGFGCADTLISGGSVGDGHGGSITVQGCQEGDYVSAHQAKWSCAMLQCHMDARLCSLVVSAEGGASSVCVTLTFERKTPSQEKCVRNQKNRYPSVKVTRANISYTVSIPSPPKN